MMKAGKKEIEYRDAVLEILQESPNGGFNVELDAYPKKMIGKGKKKEARKTQITSIKK